MKKGWICSAALAVLTTGCGVQQSIIGKADGPTAIFVTSRLNGWGVAALVLGLALVALLLFYWLRSRKK